MNEHIKKPTKIYEKVVEEIKDLISKGILEQGDPLPPERQLMDQLGVSRSSLREAFRILESLGLIESLPGKGRFVRRCRGDSALSRKVPLADGAILELVEARRVIEPVMAEEATKHATSADLRKIRRLLTTTGEDVESLTHRAECDYAFHLLLAEATHNFIYVNIMKMTFNLIMATHERIYTLLDDKKIFLEEHEKIYEAIIARDHKLAADITNKHVNRVYRTLLNGMVTEKISEAPIESGNSLQHS